MYVHLHTYMYTYKYYLLDAHDRSAFEAVEAGDMFSVEGLGFRFRGFRV